MNTAGAIVPDRQITWMQRLKYWFDILRTYQANNLGDAEVQLDFHKKLTALLEDFFGPAPGRRRLLEIGCGQRATQTILFTGDGFETIGIDIEVPAFRMSGKTFLQMVRLTGMERVLKSTCRHWLFDGSFFRRLSAFYGKPLPLDRADVRLMSATCMEFPDNYFDFIYSTQVFEHIDDVPAAAREVNRVLKPEGRAWLNVHLFPSLTGGHQPEWTDSRRASTRIPPWDHLLENKYPASTYLNRLRWSDYQKIFTDSLEVLEESPQLEQTMPLTPELEETLRAKGYTREDLLTREVVFLCRKREA
jgi:SAM-dependent methyltransferase